MIASELLVNAARHAFDDAGGTVHMELATRGGDIVCSIGDNGYGWSDSTTSRAGYGSSVVGMLVQYLGAELNVASSALGTAIELIVPLGPVS